MNNQENKPFNYEEFVEFYRVYHSLEGIIERHKSLVIGELRNPSNNRPFLKFFWDRFVKSALVYQSQNRDRWMQIIESDKIIYSTPWSNFWVWALMVCGQTGFERVYVPKGSRFLTRTIHRFSPERYDKMTGEEFEWLIHGFLSFIGFKSTLTGASHDLKADLLIETKAGRVAVQLKCWKQLANENAVMEAFCGKHYYRTEHAMVFAPLGFNSSAKLLAARLGVQLMDFNRFYEQLVRRPALFVASLLADDIRPLGSKLLLLYNEQSNSYFFEDELMPSLWSHVFFEAWKLHPGE